MGQHTSTSRSEERTATCSEWRLLDEYSLHAWGHVLLQSALEAKRAHLQSQLEDAKQLREHNERRAEGLRALLQCALTEQEAREFDAFVNVKVPTLILTHTLTRANNTSRRRVSLVVTRFVTKLTIDEMPSC